MLTNIMNLYIIVSLRDTVNPKFVLPDDCISCGTLVIKTTDQGAGLSVDELGKLFGEGVQFNVNQLQAGQGR